MFVSTQSTQQFCSFEESSPVTRDTSTTDVSDTSDGARRLQTPVVVWSLRPFPTHFPLSSGCSLTREQRAASRERSGAERVCANPQAWTCALQPHGGFSLVQCIWLVCGNAVSPEMVSFLCFHRYMELVSLVLLFLIFVYYYSVLCYAYNVNVQYFIWEMSIIFLVTTLLIHRPKRWPSAQHSLLHVSIY